MGHYKNLAHTYVDLLIEQGDKRDFDTLFELVTTHNTEENKGLWVWYDSLPEME